MRVGREQLAMVVAGVETAGGGVAQVFAQHHIERLAARGEGAGKERRQFRQNRGTDRSRRHAARRQRRDDSRHVGRVDRADMRDRDAVGRAGVHAGGIELECLQNISRADRK
jgi:hypothetical protein